MDENSRPPNGPSAFDIVEIVDRLSASRMSASVESANDCNFVLRLSQEARIPEEAHLRWFDGASAWQAIAQMRRIDEARVSWKSRLRTHGRRRPRAGQSAPPWRIRRSWSESWKARCSPGTPRARCLRRHLGHRLSRQVGGRNSTRGRRGRCRLGERALARRLPGVASGTRHAHHSPPVRRAPRVLLVRDQGSGAGCTRTRMASDLAAEQPAARSRWARCVESFGRTPPRKSRVSPAALRDRDPRAVRRRALPGP